MILELPTQPFSLTKAIDIFKNGQLKDYMDCKAYVNKYFFKTTKGQVIFYDIQPITVHDSINETKKSVLQGQWTFYDRKDASSIWLNCIFDEANEKQTGGLISNWFMKQPKNYYPSLELFKPLMYNEEGIDFINLAKTPIHERELIILQFCKHKKQVTRQVAP